MDGAGQASGRWWPRLADLPPSIFPPGWLNFSIRTWIAMCLALGTAYWSQIAAPAGAAVTVMILAQPLRGQAMSKAVYRLLGTAIGVGFSIVLAVVFPQDRSMFLGGAAIWLAFCAFIGSMERNFRAYGALLAGYTVALVALNNIDSPESIFELALSRASDITIGVVAVAIVNMAAGAPQAWRGLARGMHGCSVRIRNLGHAALHGHALPDAWDTTGLAAEILSLLTQISYAWSEIDRARLRLAGARLGIIGMLNVLTAGRAVSAITHRAQVSEIAVRHVKYWHEQPAIQIAREDILSVLLRDILEEDPDYVPTPEDAYYLERAATLISNTAHISAGMNTLLHAVPAGEAEKLAHLNNQPDYIAAIASAFRVLIGFSITAWLCIGSDLPPIHTTLSQAALTLTLASTAFDTVQFGRGALIGIPLAVASATFMNFWVLPHVTAFEMLCFVLLPQVVVSCLLLMKPNMAAIGFNYGVFFPVMLGLANENDYDPVSFLTRNVFYIFAAIMSFVTLALLMPSSPQRQRLHMAVSIARELETQLKFHGEKWGPALLSRKYDRLSTVLAWSRRIPGGGTGRRLVFDRLVRLEDLTSTLSRTRLYLSEARDFPRLRKEARRARHAVIHEPFGTLLEILEDHADAFIRLSRCDDMDERVRAITCAAGLQAIADNMRLNGDTFVHYGLVPHRRKTA